jgi:transcriptional regulator with XRE-family HTH domain
METIIALLFVLLPIIFRLIGKKLEKSGETSQAEKLRKIAEALGADEDESPFAEWLKEHEREETSVEEPVKVPKLVKPEVKPVEKFVPRNAVPAAQRKKMPILKEEKPKNREKIDPKKLIVYFEIMKPKYTE